MFECDDGQGVCFQGELSYLSNFHSAPLYYKNKYFEHSEQAFQWAKAVSSNDHEKARQILIHENPLDVKQLGDEVTPSEQWTLSEENTLRAITHAKFSQNRALGERLKNSPFINFYECTKSTYWGTGFKLPSNTREIDTSKFEGENKFGLILKDVKTRLIKAAQRPASPQTKNA